MKLLEEIPVKALAHITGGGIIENLPRVLPNNIEAIIDKKSWQPPAIFNWLQVTGNVAENEMWRTFNCGVGMIICVPQDYEDATLKFLEALGEAPWKIGTLKSSEDRLPHVSII